ncbi:hypothetical protein [Rickettsiella endosymbiont of Dermanyssus gallinae]|uniref:hypothetical protein n=1 Tax=Rickettsiella endosymbiont of Dermanyssus gallinae TaxID=2856608 RepID=UPI001C5307AC|nr:hypothetical protein [Rickettsiella endosymbiont of Dermanyssus gallinae]
MSKNSRLVLEPSLKKETERERIKRKEKYTRNTKILYAPISIGQSYHDKKMFLEFLNLIEKNFQKLLLVRFIVVDSPQRFRLAIDKKVSFESMLGEAKKLGDEWEKDCKFLAEDKLTCKIEFIKWDSWVNHPYYDIAMGYIKNLYNNNDEFKESIEKDIIEFERRHFNRKKELFIEKDREGCRTCLLDECAGFIVWDRDIVSIGNTSLVYPNRLTNSISFIKNEFTMFKAFSCVLKPFDGLPDYSSLNKDGLNDNVKFRAL